MATYKDFEIISVLKVHGRELSFRYGDLVVPESAGCWMIDQKLLQIQKSESRYSIECHRQPLGKSFKSSRQHFIGFEELEVNENQTDEAGWSWIYHRLQKQTLEIVLNEIPWAIANKMDANKALSINASRT